MAKVKKAPRRKFQNRQKNTAKYQLSKDTTVDYKKVSILQKFLNDRGKIVPRRISGVTAKRQREITIAIKRARFLALLTSGGIKK